MGDVGSHLEVAEGATALDVVHAIGNAFADEVGEFLVQVGILKQDRAAGTGGERGIVGRRRRTGVGRRHGRRLPLFALIAHGFAPPMLRVLHAPRVAAAPHEQCRLRYWSSAEPASDERRSQSGVRLTQMFRSALRHQNDKVRGAGLIFWSLYRDEEQQPWPRILRSLRILRRKASTAGKSGVNAEEKKRGR